MRTGRGSKKGSAFSIGGAMVIFWIVVVFYVLVWLMWAATFTLAWDVVTHG